MYGFNEVDAATLAQWIAAGEPVQVVDVRTPGETARGVIEGAELLPLHLLPLQASVGNGRTKTVFYCQSGARSAQACMFMTQKGDTEVYNLQGGILAWVRSGLALVAPDLQVSHG